MDKLNSYGSAGNESSRGGIDVDRPYLLVLSLMISWYNAIKRLLEFDCEKGYMLLKAHAIIDLLIE
jgi:hypothetical protein